MLATGRAALFQRSLLLRLTAAVVRSTTTAHRTMSTTTTTTANPTQGKPPLPPFTRETAIQKIRLAENAWNSQVAATVSMAYTPTSVWRNRDVFLQGREEIRHFLTGKWEREQDYRLIKELWAYTDNRIAVRFCYEYHTADGQWFRAHGNENWEFHENGLMTFRHASINDVKIEEADRKFFWPQGTRPEDHPGLTQLGL